MASIITTQEELESSVLFSLSKNQEFLGGNGKLEKIVFHLVLENLKNGKVYQKAQQLGLGK